MQKIMMDGILNGLKKQMNFPRQHVQGHRSCWTGDPILTNITRTRAQELLDRRSHFDQHNMYKGTGAAGQEITL